MDVDSSLWEPINHDQQTTVSPQSSVKDKNSRCLKSISLYSFMTWSIIVTVIRQCRKTIWRNKVGECGAIVAPLCRRAGLPFVWDLKCFLRKPIWVGGGGTGLVKHDKRAHRCRATDHVVTYLRRIPALGKQTWIKKIMHACILSRYCDQIYVVRLLPWQQRPHY
jgi:hypothetical protein